MTVEPFKAYVLESRHRSLVTEHDSRSETCTERSDKHVLLVGGIRFRQAGEEGSCTAMRVGGWGWPTASNANARC